MVFFAVVALLLQLQSSTQALANYDLSTVSSEASWKVRCKKLARVTPRRQYSPLPCKQPYRHTSSVLVRSASSSSSNLPSYSRSKHNMLTERGGHIEDPSKNSSKQQRNIKLAVFGAFAMALASWKREFLLAVFYSIKSFHFKEWLVIKLDAMNALGTRGLVIYSISLLLWEVLVGVTTPVETAAGMAFGAKNGIIASSVGKIGGYITAYLLGKFVLRDFVKRKLSDNEMMALTEDSIKTNPLGVALIWRFSPLPEFVKNFGLAVLPLKTWQFVVAVILHGFPFTCIWTCLGAETGMMMRGITTEPSRVLKIIVAGVPWFGVFISPTLFGLWVKGLKDKQKSKKDT